LDKKKTTILCVSIGAVGLIIAAVVVVLSLTANREPRPQGYTPKPPQQQYYTDPPQTAPPPVYYPTEPQPVYYPTEPAPTQPPPTMPPETAPPATEPAISYWAVEVWKEGNPPPIGAAFFTDYDKALAWSKSPTKGWQRGSGPIPYNGDKAAYLRQFGESDPSTYTPVEITP